MNKLILLLLPACNAITPSLLGPSQDGASGPQDASGSNVPTDAPMNFPTSGLIANFDFENGAGTTVADKARGMDATLSDAAMWSTTGRNGAGIKLNGASPATQFVTLPSGTLTGVDDFTISAWIKLAGNPAWARIYDIGNGLADPQNRFMYLTTSGFTTGGVSDGIHASSYGGSATNENVTATSTFLPTGVWKHIALVGSGGNRTLYIDGFPAAEVANGPTVAPREMEPIGTSSWIGKSRFASDPGFPGEMDEFRIYNRVLTASEIGDLAWPKADYSYWRFDESSGAAAADKSDRALPTALANGASWGGGRLGGAVVLAGGAAGSAGAHVVITGNPLAQCTSSLTIAAWLKISAYATNARLFDFGKGTTHEIYLAPNDGTGMHVGVKSPAGSIDLVTTTPPIPADNTWHHVAVTIDGGGVVVLYVDGAPAKTMSAGAIRAADFATLDEALLGKSRGSDPFFSGAVDELRIGCRALTADEIKNLAHPQ